MLIVLSAPTLWAYSSAAVAKSVMTISFAPAALAANKDNVPMGPLPVIRTRLPSRSPARFAACKHTANGSAIAASAELNPLAFTHCDATATSSSRNAP